MQREVRSAPAAHARALETLVTGTVWGRQEMTVTEHIARCNNE